MKYAKTMDDSFPIVYEREKPKFDQPVMFLDGTFARLQDDDVVCLGHPRCLSFYMRREHIIKEADNIEDLFDEYVLEDKDHTYQSLLVNANPYDKVNDKLPFSQRFTEDVKNKWLSYCSTYLQRGYRIYGAIVIRGAHGEPILQPVAVMNDKGEWELL